MNSPDFGFAVKEKIAALEAALLSAAPQLPVLLRDIHTQLKANKEIVTILTDEERSVIVRGLMRQTNVSIADAVSKKKSKEPKKKVTDDLADEL